MTPAINDFVHIAGMVTLIGKKPWRKTMIGTAYGKLVEKQKDGYWVLRKQEFGLCRIHESAIVGLERELPVKIYRPGIDPKPDIYL